MLPPSMRIGFTLIVTSCGFNSNGLGGDASDSIGGGSSSTAASTSSSTTVMPGGTEAPESSGDTADACPPGNIGCPCDGTACNEGLYCVDDVCASSTCGDAIVQPGEECDPGAPVDDDGCEADCSFSRGARSVALGSEHTCIVGHFGEVRCWGDGERGKTGHGSKLDVGDMPGETAAADRLDLGVDGIDRVALGTGFSCALRKNGEVVCWGYRASGRLGDGLNDPTQDIADEAGEAAGMLGKVSIPGTVVDLALGGSHACVVRRDQLGDAGSVYCWGLGMGGRLGYANQDDVGQTNNPATVGPVQLRRGFDPKQIVAGAGHTCALSQDGNVACWGDAETGILGNLSDVDIGDDEAPIDGDLVELGGVAVAISAGSQHTCALMDDGAVRCWGLGTLGRLGYGNEDTIGDDEAPGDLMVPLAVPAFAVSAGRAHTCALLGDNSVLCWGDGASGKLGRGDEENIGDDESLADLAPIEIDDDPLTIVRAVETGGDHTCAVLEDGRVRCWGLGAVGQLGYGNKDAIGDDELPREAGDVDFGE